MKFLIITKNNPPVFWKRFLFSIAGNDMIFRRPVKDSFLGFHTKTPLRIIIDEAYVTDELYETALMCCTGEDQKVIVI